MKLAISNIAWEDPFDRNIFDLLRKFNVRGIEVAPTKFWPEWENITDKKILEVKKRLTSEGFEIPAMQSILYIKPDCQVFGDNFQLTSLLEHLKIVSNIAHIFEVKVLVFGAPSNRRINSLNNKEVEARSYAVFNQMADICKSNEIILCFEPNPTIYGCDFVINGMDGYNFVKKLNHSSLKLHLDSACMHLENDSTDVILTASDQLFHFHVSEPNLGEFDNTQVDHTALSRNLDKIEYDNWVSIEMRPSSQPDLSIETALEVVRKTYFNYE